MDFEQRSNDLHDHNQRLRFRVEGFKRSGQIAADFCADYAGDWASGGRDCGLDWRYCRRRVQRGDPFRAQDHPASGGYGVVTISSIRKLVWEKLHNLRATPESGGGANSDQQWARDATDHAERFDSPRVGSKHWHLGVKRIGLHATAKSPGRNERS